jgi:rifampicin phosphotransferase
MSRTLAPPVRPLDRLGLADVPAAGRKAAVLGELSQAGQAVPPGFVVTADVLAGALAAAGLGPDAEAADVRSVPVPTSARDAIARELARLVGAGPAGAAVAVRSSGIAEDEAGRSYAGQYDSVLDVTGLAAVLDAIRACWASAFAGHVRTYREHAAGPTIPDLAIPVLAIPDLATPAAPAMAVIVQQMAPAAAAGVAFSANPVTGDRDEVIISAVRGLADGLAAGRVTPEEWSVRGGVAALVAGGQGALDAAAALAVAGVTRRIATLLGAPQDVEWTWSAGQVHVVQARPVTALPAPPGESAAAPRAADGGSADRAPTARLGPPHVREDELSGFWLRGNYSLQPLSVMNIGTILRAVNESSHELFRYALGERIEVRSVQGWSYVRFVPMPDEPAAQARLARIAAALRADEPRAIVRRWREQWEPAARGLLPAARGRDLAGLADDQLAAEVHGRHRAADAAQRRHFLVGGASCAELGPLGLLCEQELGWSVPEVLRLLAGLPGLTTAPTAALGRLVTTARGDQALGRLLTGPGLTRTGDPVWDQVRRDHPGFAAEATAYLAEYGVRSLGADIAEPTMAERPDLLLRLVADQLRSGTDPADPLRAARADRQTALALARAALAARGAAVAARFEAAQRRAEDAYPLRDDTAYFAHQAWALLRAALLEAGGRLARRGQLDTAADVFRLTAGETCDALDSRRPLQRLAAARGAELRWAAEHQGPLTLGARGAAPLSLGRLLPGRPERDRAELAALGWVDTAYGIGAHRVEQSGHRLRGVGASPGRYTGPVRVLRSEADFPRLTHGDVLVCPETTPQWSVLFSSVGALVTDTGGLLSHPAIIAREYQIPAVVATGNATTLLRDGQLVTVDGGAGLVEVAEDA